MKKIIITVGNNKPHIIGFSSSLHSFLITTQKDFIDLEDLKEDASFYTVYHRHYGERVHFKTETITPDVICYMKEFKQL